jgi:hypothetical protein
MLTQHGCFIHAERRKSCATVLSDKFPQYTHFENVEVSNPVKNVTLFQILPPNAIPCSC